MTTKTNTKARKVSHAVEKSYFFEKPDQKINPVSKNYSETAADAKEIDLTVQQVHEWLCRYTEKYLVYGRNDTIVKGQMKFKTIPTGLKLLNGKQ